MCIRDRAYNYFKYQVAFWDEYIEVASFLEAWRNLSYLHSRFSKTRAIKKVLKVVKSRYDKRKVLGENDTYPLSYTEVKTNSLLW